MLMSVVIVVLLSLPSTASILTCQPSFTCPGSPVSCECQGVASVRWEVFSTMVNMDIRLFDTTHLDSTPTGQDTSTNSLYSAVLCNITQDPDITGPLGIRLTSKLNFNLTRSVNVGCTGNDDSNTIPLQRSSSPSPPRNLHSTLTSIGTDSVAVRLDWDPPLNDGGVAITNYLIFVNMSQLVSTTTTTTTTTTVTLSSMGPHLIEISAVNDCGIMGGNISSTVDFDMLPLTTASTEDNTDKGGGEIVSPTTVSATVTKTMPPTALLTLSTAAVVGVVIALLVIMAMVYTCGILTGFLLRRRKNNHTPSASGDLSSPMYEQVLSPTKTSISLKENVAYGQFSS